MFGNIVRLCLITGVFLLGCQPQPSLLPTQVVSLPSATEGTTINPTPINILRPTVAKPTLIATSPIQNVYEEIPVCLSRGIAKPLSEKSGIQGIIVYTDEKSHGLYAVGGIPLRQFNLLSPEPQTNLRFLGFSPDGKWLAYLLPLAVPPGPVVFDTPTVELLSSAGEKRHLTIDPSPYNSKKSFYYWAGVSESSYWINNQSILFELMAKVEEPGRGGIFYDTVYNPFQGKWIVDPFEGMPGRDLADDMGVSPDLSRALYEVGDSLILWDLANNTKIWSTQQYSKGVYGTNIIWSPDSSMVAVNSRITYPGKWSGLLISRDGSVKENFNDVLSDNLFRSLFSMKWSPDSHYLSFVGYHNDVNIFYVYDILAGKFISQCPTVGFRDFGESLIWSPDSASVIYSTFNSPIEIMDINTGEVTSLGINGYALGWSDAFTVPEN
jgi:hypothetical protein